jgi:hypothetical protein
MRGGVVPALPANIPVQNFICGSKLVTGGDLAPRAARPPGGWPLVMEGSQLHAGFAPAPAGAPAGAPAVQPGDNNYTLYQYQGTLRAVHSSKLPVAGRQHIQVHI